MILLTPEQKKPLDVKGWLTIPGVLDEWRMAGTDGILVEDDAVLLRVFRLVAHLSSHLRAVSRQSSSRQRMAVTQLCPDQVFQFLLSASRRSLEPATVRIVSSSKTTLWL